MRLAALSTGASVPTGDFAGRIAAVHTHVCGLSLVDETLLTLATPVIGRLPRSIMLDAPPEFVFRDIVSIGASFAARSGILRIGGSLLSVDLRSAAPWRSRLRNLGLDGTRASVALAMETACRLLRQDGRSDTLIRIAGERLDALTSATGKLDVAVAAASMSGLIGLGEGATPAGDDYLVGYFAGLWASAGKSAARLSFIAALGEPLRRSTQRTGRVSRVYLEAAFEEEVSERLFDFASGIAAGSDAAAVARVTAAALAVGHSSGACGLLGFLQACACWRSPERPHGSPSDTN